MTTTDTVHTPVHVVLVPGYWLGAWAWDDVVPALTDAGMSPHPVTLPGLESPETDRTGVTLDDHVRAVSDLVSSLEGDVVLVGHSGGAPVVQQVTDQHPDRIRRVIYVDSGPMLDGVALFPDVPEGTVDMPFPDDAGLAAGGTSTEGLDASGLAALRDRAVPQPAGVARTPVHVADERRFAVPVTAICTSLPSTDLRQLAEVGHLPTELFRYEHLEMVDLPTGHWPMLSRPADLGGLIARAAAS
jgi:pimeloyl-ACP methyl ester carboxylesterase